jgi:hypothetical protein
VLSSSFHLFVVPLGKQDTVERENSVEIDFSKGNFGFKLKSISGRLAVDLNSSLGLQSFVSDLSKVLFNLR